MAPREGRKALWLALCEACLIWDSAEDRKGRGSGFQGWFAASQLCPEQNTSPPEIHIPHLLLRVAVTMPVGCNKDAVWTEKAMAPHSSTLAWKIPWMEEPGRLQSMASRRVGHDWATSLSLFTFMRWRRKWQPTPVFLLGESQGWGRIESDMTEVIYQQFEGLPGGR